VMFGSTELFPSSLHLYLWFPLLCTKFVINVLFVIYKGHFVNLVFRVHIENY